jgi:DGQHR domain-containing protein
LSPDEDAYVTLDLSRDRAEELLGSKSIILGPCLVGPSLNMTVIRGFAPIHHLAIPSAPDIFDGMDNPTGTQRDLNKKHARESMEYAVEAASVGPSEDPRTFPEVLLNVRDSSVIRVYDPEHPEQAIDFSSLQDFEEAGLPVQVLVEISLDDLHMPQTAVRPQVSRVDGNHRLSGFDVLIEQALEDDGLDPEEFPVVPFALSVGLNDLQEAKLFRDINGNTKKMETDHLLQINIRSTGEVNLKASQSLDDRALWLAEAITREDRAFHARVFKGGSKEGVRKAYGGTPPLRFNTLRRSVKILLQHAPSFDAGLRSAEGADAQLEILDRFWKAVSRVFPEAWEDKKNYMLLQTVGLDGMSTYAGALVDEAYKGEKWEEEDFIELLQPIASFDMSKASHSGLTGGAGTKEFVRRMYASADPDAALAGKAIAKLTGGESH